MKLILVSIDVGTAGNQLLHHIKLTRAGSGHEHRLAAVAHGLWVGAWAINCKAISVARTSMAT